MCVALSADADVQVARVIAMPWHLHRHCVNIYIFIYMCVCECECECVSEFAESSEANEPAAGAVVVIVLEQLSSECSVLFSSISCDRFDCAH